MTAFPIPLGPVVALLGFGAVRHKSILSTAGVSICHRVGLPLRMRDS